MRVSTFLSTLIGASLALASENSPVCQQDQCLRSLTERPQAQKVLPAINAKAACQIYLALGDNQHVDLGSNNASSVAQDILGARQPLEIDFQAGLSSVLTVTAMPTAANSLPTTYLVEAPPSNYTFSRQGAQHTAISSPQPLSKNNSGACIDAAAYSSACSCLVKTTPTPTAINFLANKANLTMSCIPKPTVTVTVTTSSSSSPTPTSADGKPEYFFMKWISGSRQGKYIVSGDRGLFTVSGASGAELKAERDRAGDQAIALTMFHVDEAGQLWKAAVGDRSKHELVYEHPAQIAGWRYWGFGERELSKQNDVNGIETPINVYLNTSTNQVFVPNGPKGNGLWSGTGWCNGYLGFRSYAWKVYGEPGCDDPEAGEEDDGALLAVWLGEH